MAVDPRKMDGFTVVNNPSYRGRLTGQSNFLMPKQQERKVVDLEAYVNDLKKVATEIVSTAENFDSDAGIAKLPFEKKQQVKYLKSIETYLQAQLKAVQEEIFDITKPPVED